MQALVRRGLRVEERAVPEPGRGEVRVRVLACGMNASDWEFVTGVPGYARVARVMMRVDVLGSDVCGIVDAVGEGAGFVVGERVVGDVFERFGGCAAFCVAKADRWVRVPAGISDVDAAAVPQSAAIALGGTDGVRAGDRVLVNGGGGGSGPLAIQLAKLAGAEVWGCDAAGKADVMRAAGADHVVDYRAEDAFAVGGFHRILDLWNTRSPGAVRRALAEGGRYLTVGGPMRVLLAIAVAGIGRRDVGVLMAQQGAESVARMLGLMEEGQVRAVVGRVAPLAEAAQALVDMGEGRIAGKLVIEMEGEA